MTSLFHFQILPLFILLSLAKCNPADNLISRVATLATHGTVINPSPIPAGVDRSYLSPAGSSARAAILAIMHDAGMSARIDGAGNVIGRLSCRRGGKRRVVLLGSHFDTVRNGGQWDGAYGVLAGIAVAEEVSLRDGGVCGLGVDIEVVAFDDEEGNNEFGLTNSGVKAFTGVEIVIGDDARREKFEGAYHGVFEDGDSPRYDVWSRLKSAERGNWEEISAWLEVHIEQGPVLEREGAAVGSVVAISGQTRMTLRWVGEKGHAGTVPMVGRRDALVAAAMLIVEVERLAKAATNVVATVGKISVLHESSNSVPGEVVASFEVRSADDGERARIVREMLEFGKTIGAEKGVRFESVVDHEVEAVAMTKWVQAIVKDAVKATAGVASESVLELSSGAGHDTMIMANVTNIGMLLVRCTGGVSHSPWEEVSKEDGMRGYQVLLRAVEFIAKRELSKGVVEEKFVCNEARSCNLDDLSI